MDKFNGYELSRNWFDFCFVNPERVKPIHSAIYFFAIEHCNRLGWKDKFGFPSQMVMEAIGVKNWRTYIKAFNEVIEFGFIELIEKSQNQYSSNVIAIVKNTKAHTKALDKALQKHIQKHSTKQSSSTVSIDKQYNNKPLNNITGKNEISVINNKAELLNSHSFLTDVMRVHKITLPQLTNYIEQFNLIVFDKHDDFIDYRSHFSNWIKIQITKIDNRTEKQNYLEPDRSDSELVQRTYTELKKKADQERENNKNKPLKDLITNKFKN